MESETFLSEWRTRMAGANDSYQTAVLPVLKAARDWHEFQTEAKRCTLLGS